MKILYGVGVGPGDPELLTVKAIRIIREVEHLFVPRTKLDAPGMAEAIVAEHLAGKQPIYLHLPMGADNAARYRAIAETIAATVQDGKRGAFITLGDPAIYSTFTYIMFEARRLGMEIAIVPGIPSFCAAAAALREPLVIKDENFYLADGQVDEAMLACVQSVCVLKPRKEIAATLDTLARHGFEIAALKRCSLPEETILRDRAQIANDRDYMMLLLARKTE